MVEVGEPQGCTRCGKAKLVYYELKNVYLSLSRSVVIRLVGLDGLLKFQQYPLCRELFLSLVI